MSGSLPTTLASSFLPSESDDLDFVGGFDHVVVGEDVAAGADDHARAQAGALFSRSSSPKKRRSIGSFSGGLRGTRTSFEVKMFTTEGIALCTAVVVRVGARRRRAPPGGRLLLHARADRRQRRRASAAIRA